LEAGANAIFVTVERVAVLHDELADPEEAAARPRLIPGLGLEVVPELRQIPVALDFARVERDRLLVRERQDEVATGPVLEMEDLRDRKPPRGAPPGARRRGAGPARLRR